MNRSAGRIASSILPLLAAQFLFGVHPLAVSAKQLATLQPSSPREMTEKERIGSDVPMASWRDTSMSPSLVLLCLHGFGLNKNAYEPLGKRLSQLGFVTYAVDIRGFGNWLQTQECATFDFDAALADVKSALISVHKAHPNLPVVLVGESMGGALAVQATAANPSLVDALISSVPSGDRFGQPVTDLKVALGMLKGRGKEMTVGTALAKKITKDPSLRQALVDEPEARTTATPKELMSFQAFMNRTPERAKQITSVPVLIFQGGSDRLVKPAGTERIFQLLPTKDKSLVLLGTSEHLILENGQYNDTVVDGMTSWMLKHVAPLSKRSATERALSDLDSDDSLSEGIGHFRFGQGYIKFKDYKKAREELLEALQLGRGTPLARLAMNCLLGLPQDSLAPRRMDGSELTKAIQLTTPLQALANDKPSVIFFGADWIDSCKAVNSMLDRVMVPFADKINYVKVDADDPKSQDLCKKFSISPLPAILFLNGTNDVISYTIGVIDEPGLKQELAKIVPDQMKEQLIQQ